MDYIVEQLTLFYKFLGLVPTGRGTGPTDIAYYAEVVAQTGGWTHRTAEGGDNIGYWEDRIKADLIAAKIPFGGTITDAPPSPQDAPGAPLTPPVYLGPIKSEIEALKAANALQDTQVRQA